MVPIFTRDLIAYVLSIPELDAHSRRPMDINLYSGAVDKTHSVRVTRTGGASGGS